MKNYRGRNISGVLTPEMATISIDGSKKHGITEVIYTVPQGCTARLMASYIQPIHHAGGGSVYLKLNNRELNTNGLFVTGYTGYGTYQGLAYETDKELPPDGSMLSYPSPGGTSTPYVSQVRNFSNVPVYLNEGDTLQFYIRVRTDVSSEIGSYFLSFLEEYDE